MIDRFTPQDLPHYAAALQLLGLDDATGLRTADGTRIGPFDPVEGMRPLSVANATIFPDGTRPPTGVPTACAGIEDTLAATANDLITELFARDTGVVMAIGARGPITKDLDARTVCTAIGALTIDQKEYAIDTLEAVCALETSSGLVGAAKSMIERIENLSTNSDDLFNRRKRGQLKNEYGRLYETFGDLRGIDFGKFTMARPLRSPLHIVGRTAEAFLLPYHEESGAAILFPYGPNALELNGCIPGNQHERILDELFARDLITYDLERARERMDRFEEDILVQHIHYVRDQVLYEYLPGWRKEDAALQKLLMDGFPTKFDRFKAFQRFSSGQHATNFHTLMGKGWRQLRDVLYNDRSPSILPIDQRVNLLYAVSEQDIVTRRILARIVERDHPERFLHFRRGFDQDYLAADDAKRKAIVARMRNFNAVACDEAIASWLAEVPE